MHIETSDHITLICSPRHTCVQAQNEINMSDDKVQSTNLSQNSMRYTPIPKHSAILPFPSFNA